MKRLIILACLCFSLLSCGTDQGQELTAKENISDGKIIHSTSDFDNLVSEKFDELKTKGEHVSHLTYKQKVYVLELFYGDLINEITQADYETFEILGNGYSGLIARDKNNVYILGGAERYAVLPEIDTESVEIVNIERGASSVIPYVKDKNGLYYLSNSPQELYFAKLDPKTLETIDIYWNGIGEDRYKFMKQ